ncbi:MAG TPA: O-antigen ligase family protein [Gemmatimonadaceae bacterium]|nr:O-antigen ligase family protein [Gemmatimonadaceae bacterium]
MKTLAPAAPRLNPTPPRPRRLPEVDASSGRWWGPVICVFVVLVWATSPFVGFRIALTILMLGGFAALLAGVFRPTLGLVGVTILSVLDGPSRVYLLTGGPLRWNTFNYCLLLVMLWYLPFLARLRDRHSVTLFAFITLLFVDMSISNEIGEAVQHILGIITLFGILVFIVRAGYDRRMWFWVAVIAGLIGALGGLCWFYEQLSLPKINENAWAMFPATALFAICLGFPSAVSMRRGQPTLMALAGVNMVWIFLSGSRGTLGIGCCCIIVMLLTMRGVRQRTVAVASGVLLMFAAASHFGNLQDRALFRIEKLFTTDQGLTGDYSLSSRTSGRSDLAIGGWYIFEEHPLGVGTGGFKIAWRDLDRHDNMGDYARGEMRAAHSGWIKTLAENGVPGMILLTAWVFSFAYAGLRTRKRVLRRLAFLTTIAITAALLATEFQSKGLWYFAAGATAFLERESLERAMYGERWRRPAVRARRPVGAGAQP